MNKLLDIDLPKWPAVRIVGQPVTLEQAKDIIFKCDPFLTDWSEYSGGNEYTFNENYRKQSKLTVFETPDDIYDKMLNHFGIISHELTYLYIDLASSCYMGGPTGWCNINGQIYLENKNVGKWPTPNELLDDLKLIATTFPYLDMECTIYDAEYGEESCNPVITFLIKDGLVEVVQPQESPIIESSLERESVVGSNGGSTFLKELGLPRSWYDHYAKMISDYVDNNI